jgi:predicted nucleic acid-binding protein
VKLYADEPGHAAVRRLRSLVISSIARVEVPAALWRKERLGELQSADAEVLVAAFEADYHGTDSEPPAFAAVALAPVVLETAAQVTATHALRAYDAVQLASAVAAREADPGCAEFACYDDALRAGAARSGFGLIPA